MIVLLAAMEVEVRAVRRALSVKESGQDGRMRYWRGTTTDGTPVVLASSGIGQKSAATATTLLIDDFAPRAILNFGVAGGLRGGLNLGEVVVCRSVMDTAGGRHEGSKTLAALARRELEALRLSWREGVSVSVDRVIETPAAKAVLQHESGADIVEMESFAAARVAAAHDIPFLCLRSISDLDEEELPDFSTFMQDNRIVPRRLATYLARHPRQAPSLWHFFRVTAAASRTFALVLPRIARAFGDGTSST